MATRHTVSDEMAWTDWSSPDERVQSTDRRSSWPGAVMAILIAIAALACIVYLLPTGS